MWKGIHKINFTHSIKEIVTLLYDLITPCPSVSDFPIVTILDFFQLHRIYLIAQSLSLRTSIQAQAHTQCVESIFRGFTPLCRLKHPKLYSQGILENRNEETVSFPPSSSSSLTFRVRWAEPGGGWLKTEMWVLLRLKAVLQSLECTGSPALVPTDIRFSSNFLISVWSYSTHSLLPIVKSSEDPFWLILGILLNYPNSSLLSECTVDIKILSKVWIWGPIDMLPQTLNPMS